MLKIAIGTAFALGLGILSSMGATISYDYAYGCQARRAAEMIDDAASRGDEGQFKAMLGLGLKLNKCRLWMRGDSVVVRDPGGFGSSWACLSEPASDAPCYWTKYTAIAGGDEDAGGGQTSRPGDGRELQEAPPAVRGI